MFGREGGEGYAGTEGAGGIETAAGPVDASEFCDEQSQAYADGSDEGGFVLFRGEHEDGEDEFGGEEHLDEDAASEGNAGTQARGNGHFAWEKGGDDTRSSHGTEKFSHEGDTGSDPGHAADERETECHGGIEEAAGDAEEDPGIDSQTKAESQAYVE